VLEGHAGHPETGLHSHDGRHLRAVDRCEHPVGGKLPHACSAQWLDSAGRRHGCGGMKLEGVASLRFLPRDDSILWNDVCDDPVSLGQVRSQPEEKKRRTSPERE
jgi:hypothetical protein